MSLIMYFYCWHVLAYLRPAIVVIFIIIIRLPYAINIFIINRVCLLVVESRRKDRRGLRQGSYQRLL